MSALVALLKGRLEGLLTEEEFENAKKQLLAEAAPPPSAAAPATPSLLPESRSTSGGDIPACPPEKTMAAQVTPTRDDVTPLV